MENPPAIVFERVNKRYESGGQPVAALVDLNLHVPVGQFLSVMGPSGSGKSTLLNLIAGLDAPSEGRIYVNGQDLSRMSDDARSDLRLQSIGFVFQSFNLFPNFTVGENVGWPLRFLGVGRHSARDRARDALHQWVSITGRLTDGPPSCPVASNSVSPLPARWSPSRSSCWQTNQPGTSTHRRGRRFSTY